VGSPASASAQGSAVAEFLDRVASRKLSPASAGTLHANSWSKVSTQQTRHGA
jgi:hypothetical protein